MSPRSVCGFGVDCFACVEVFFAVADHEVDVAAVIERFSDQICFAEREVGRVAVDSFEEGDAEHLECGFDDVLAERGCDGVACVVFFLEFGEHVKNAGVEHVFFAFVADAEVVVLEESGHDGCLDFFIFDAGVFFDGVFVVFVVSVGFLELAKLFLGEGYAEGCRSSMACFFCDFLFCEGSVPVPYDVHRWGGRT